MRSDIGRPRIEIGQDNKEAVYLAIRNLTIYNPKKKGVSLREIWKELDERTQWQNKDIKKRIYQIYEKGSKSWTPAEIKEALRKEKKKTITIRTIQTCIKNDPRIKKDGWLFYLDYETMFEKRYLNPSSFGRTMYRAIYGLSYDLDRDVRLKQNLSKKDYLYTEVKQSITEFGIFLVYSFLEAARPFTDQSMSLTERGDLVHYWVQNSVPIFEMFNDFIGLLDDRTSREKENRNLAGSEIDEESVKTGLQILEDLYPDHYKALEEKFNEEFLYTVVRKRGKIDHFVRGKSYHKEAPE